MPTGQEAVPQSAIQIDWRSSHSCLPPAYCWRMFSCLPYIGSSTAIVRPVSSLQKCSYHSSRPTLDVAFAVSHRICHEAVD